MTDDFEEVDNEEDADHVVEVLPPPVPPRRDWNWKDLVIALMALAIGWHVVSRAFDRFGTPAAAQTSTQQAAVIPQARHESPPATQLSIKEIVHGSQLRLPQPVSRPSPTNEHCPRGYHRHWSEDGPMRCEANDPAW